MRFVTKHALCCVFLILPTIASGQKLNDLTVYPAPPPPTLPPAGGTFQDPTFGTTILRVTDQNDGTLNVPMYSAVWPAFNADSSRILYFNTTGNIMTADLDVPNRKVSNKRFLPATPTGYGGPAYWHRTDPNLLFIFSGSNLYEYSFQTGQFTKIVDFSTLLPGVVSVGSRGMSFDGNRFQVTFGGPNLQPIPGADGVFIYDRSLNSLVYYLDPNRVNGDVKSQMDSSGRYILDINYLVDSATNVVVDEMEPGHYDANFGMIATYLDLSGYGFFIGYRKLDPNGASYGTAYYVGPQTPWADDVHFGLWDYNGEWLTGSYEATDVAEYYNAAQQYTLPSPWQWVWDSQPPNAHGHWNWIGQGPRPSFTPFPLDVVYEGEIFQTSLNVPPLTVVTQFDTTNQVANPVGPVTLPSGKVYATWADFQANENPAAILSANPVNRRICKHYSNPLIANSAISYWAQPHAIGSPDNRVVMFGSNFGDPNRVDLFIAFIDTVSGAQPSCSYTLSTTTLNVEAVASSGTITVTPSSRSCGPPAATSNVSWASVSVSGNAVNWSVAANTSSETRTGVIGIAGQTVVITQAPTGKTITMTVFPGSLIWAMNRTSSTGPQSVSLTFSGGVGTTWTASSNEPNIIVSPTSGVGNGTLQITATTGSNGIVTINAPDALNSPQVIQVQITTPLATAPFGSFDTPVNDSRNISAAVAVTGWALDSVGINKVDIWREPVGSEPPGLVYIGDAVFVPGARPDVAAAFSAYPNSNSSGWGYLLLTNFLPNANGARGSANGTYILHALAHNRAGMTVDLGARAIAVDNADATLPFGTIDTPAQGATISGNNYVNFGWALTPMPALIPTDGATITVNVDGMTVGHPTYNQFRGDIATVFPGFANSNGAIGFTYIDATKLSNGLHTISWNVWDNELRGNGIGSRFFYVLNSPDTPAISQPPEPGTTETSIASSSDTQFGQASDQAPPFTDDTISMQVEEMDLIQLPVGATSGYLVANGQKQPLPTGSTLQDGVFYWQLAPVFLGEYDMVFERLGSRTTHLRVLVNPKSYSGGAYQATQ